MELLKEIDKYKELLDLKDSLEEQTKANNKAIEEAKQRRRLQIHPAGESPLQQEIRGSTSGTGAAGGNYVLRSAA